MRKYVFCCAILTIAISSCVKAPPTRSSSTDISASPVLVEFAKRIGPQRIPYLSLLPIVDTPFNRQSINTETMKKCEGWIRAILKEELLPPDVFGQLKCYGNVFRYEGDGPRAKGYSRIEFDYFVLENEWNGQKYQILEDGDRLAILLKLRTPWDMSEETTVVENTSVVIRSVLRVSDNEFAKVRPFSTRDGKIIYGRFNRWGLKPNYNEIISKAPKPYTFWWWDDIEFATDGEFVFISIYEGDGKVRHIRASGNSANRF